MAERRLFCRADDGHYRYLADGSAVDTGDPDNLELFRRSDLEAAACPFRYENENPELSSGVAARGQLNHSIIREYINHLYFLDLSSDPEACLRIRDRYLAGAVLEPSLRDEVYDSISYFAAIFALDGPRYISHEERIVALPLRFTCQVDLVYGRGDAGNPESEVEVTDWKSFAGSFSGSVFDHFQARSYLCAVARRWPGFGKYRFTFHSISDGQRATEAVDAAQVQLWEADILARVKLIEDCRDTGDWPALPGRVCTYCLAQCPIVPLAADDDQSAAFRVTSEAQAVEAADAVTALQRAVKRRQDALRGWAKQNGNIIHGDGELVTGFRGVTRRWLTFHDLATITSEENVLPANVEIAASKLKGLVKGDDKCAKRLTAAIQSKTGQRFQTWKAGSESDGDE